MTEQITVPRETWDALREALEKSRSARTYSERIDAYECAVQAITAANAVSHPQATEPAPQEWISVDDQMPPPMERVLASEPRHRTVKVDMWFGPDFQWSYTHWMPLPAAPEEKQ
jgi:hypothetical protein